MQKWQPIIDMLRGFAALTLSVVAIGLIIYFVVPGMSFSPDRAVQRANNARAAIAAFGGTALVIVSMCIGIAIGTWWSR